MNREPRKINENEDKMPFDLTAAIVKEIEYQLNDVCSLLRCETGVTILQLSEYAGYYCIGSKRPSIDLYNSLIDLMQPRLMQLVPSPKESLFIVLPSITKTSWFFMLKVFWMKLILNLKLSNVIQ